MADILVTGISGFVGQHCALACLKDGHRVRGTVRSMAKADAVRQALSPHADLSDLSFHHCDLMEDDGWDEAVSGCDAVLHTASPIAVAQPDDPEVFVRPAVDGTLRVLRAAVAQGVARVVQTSSISAIHHGHGPKVHFTEADWVNLDGPGITPYVRSKTLAERAARAYADQNPALHFASVNPGFIFGPVLGPDLSPSAEMIRLFLAGKYPGAPRLCIPTVDARDVAQAHLRAATRDLPAGGRYIAVADSLWMVEITRGLRASLGAAARKAPRMTLPNWVVRTIAIADSGVQSIVAELGRELCFDTAHTQKALDLQFTDGFQSTQATGQSLIELGLV